MKKKDSYWLCIRRILLTLVLVMAGKTWAADPPLAPLVHVLATDPWAAEEGQEPGSFTVIRTGPIGEPLTVRYRMGGTAENGVDYDTLTGEVTIPADCSCAPINIFPFDDRLIERNESVVVGLVQPLDVDPPPYIVCWPSVAALTIEDNDTIDNLPPRVSLINPPDGSVFAGPVNLRLTARATDLDGRVRTVEFFADGQSLGIVTNRPIVLDPIPLEDTTLDLSRDDVPTIYPELDAAWQDLSIAPDLKQLPGNLLSLSWQDVPAGHHVLIAVATDNDGASTTSAPIEIEVTPSPTQPIVEIVAVDPVAAEPDSADNRLDTALFHVRRVGGDPNVAIPVFYRVGGSASNGADYSEIAHMVVIEPGDRAADILIKPLDDNLVEGPETVAIQILPPVCIETFPPPPDCYRVGRNSAARAVIHDNDYDPENNPPSVAIVHPLDGDVFLAPADIRIVAAAQDPDGYVVTVEFFEGENSLGVVTRNPIRLAPDLPPFVLLWSSVPPGNYVLTALATDNRGAQTLSRPVEIKVSDRGVPPVVTVRASDAEASEGSSIIASDGTTHVDTATFQVHRSGATTADLTVYYRLAGSAENGVDYLKLNSEVTIPAGSANAEVVVVPIDDNLCEGNESVRIEILPPLCIAIFPPPLYCYMVGDQGVSSAVIHDNEICPPNQPPKIAIVQPEDGVVLGGPLDVVLVAEGGDGDGTVRQVEFFAGDDSLGVVGPASEDPKHFRLVWPHVGQGAYTLTAVATDNDGLSARSDPVHIRVIEEFILPVVSIEATDPNATEGPIVIGPGEFLPQGAVEQNLTAAGPIILDTASFTVRRSGSTNDSLSVFYQISGTAENAVDYAKLTGEVSIPAGRSSMRFNVFPIDDELVEGTESVVLTLIPTPCLPVEPPPPGCYLVGNAERAVAYIRDDDERNQKPNVEIVHPSDGQIFPTGADIEINVATRDPDGWVGLVEFFDGDTKIGEDSIVFIIPPPPGQLQRFSFVWNGASPGSHVLTARATDNLGATTISEPIEIKVLEDCRLPVVNLAVVDAHASEQPSLSGVLTDPAIFRVCRSCNTDEDLLVLLEIGGTALNGGDYQFIREHVLIPAGESCAEIEVNPIDDDLVEGIETVTVRLTPSDCLAADPLPAGCYLLGSNTGGTAFIRDNDLPDNRPPKVGLISPPDGSVFLAPVDVRVVAAAEDVDGRVHTVEFFADGVSIGVVTNHPWILDPIQIEREAQLIDDPVIIIDPPIDPVPIPIRPFAILWSDVPPGEHVLTAVATDNDGASSTSDAVHIKVIETFGDPVVEVIARDPIAAEGCSDANADCGDTATFVVRRSGSTDHPLRVFYRLAGGAENGVDYTELPNSVVMEAGESHASVVIDPIDDRLVEGAERVILTLVERPCLDIVSTDIAIDPNIVVRGCYHVGRAHTAHAVIFDNDTPPNAPPVVRWVEPSDGDIFRAPASIKLAASAFDLDGQVVHVEFFEGENSLGIVPTPEILPYAYTDASLDPNSRIMLPLFVLEWPDVPAGRYVLTAVATDDRGESSISEPVEIKVVSPSVPPLVNLETIDNRAMEQSPFVDSLPDIAIFHVTRSGGDWTRPLEVFYRVGGSAENGVDYDKLAGSVVIEPGEAYAEIVINPIDDLVCEGSESIRIGLVPHPCIAVFPPPRECYAVGPNDKGRATLFDDDVCPPNQPPRIAIMRPEDGDVFRAPADLLVCALAKDADGRVVRVDFYANDESIGSARVNSTNEPELFCVKWEDVPAGGYELTAVATDNEGATTRSEPIHIRVIARPLMPIVTLVATDAVASEEGADGAFVVTRDCCTAYPLHVRYSLEGTGRNGVDYSELTGFVTIPEGARSARIVVDPIDDNLVEGTETVVAHLEPALCAAASPLPVDCYRIGHPSRDVVFIRDNDSSDNEPPLIAILAPSEGSVFGAPANIPILAVGLDSDGWISSVEFFANDEKIGELVIQFIVPPPPGQLQTFDLDWSDVPEGDYTLTARATDQRGASTMSGPVHIRVVDPCRVPVVSVHAPDPIALEGGSDDDRTATFVLSRGCGFAVHLSVQYAVTGTAGNGVDYSMLTGVAEFEPGAESVRVVIDPLEDNLPEGVETIILELIQPPCVADLATGEGCYLVGQPHRALAYIRDNDNQLPKVEMVRPFDGQIFQAPAEIEMIVETVDPDGWVGEIQFLANGDVIAHQVIDFLVPPPPGQKQEFSFTWNDVAVGQYILTARVFDNEGAASESEPVVVKVGESEPPPVVIMDAIDGYAREGTTNTAVFAVRRIGNTSEPLTVHFGIRGTAENGIDYKLIPDSVEIPAGRSSKRIVIEAVADDAVEDLETVALQLRLPDPSNSNADLSYVIGRPDVAAAVIVDATHDRPGCRHLGDGMFHVCLPGRDGEGFRILATTDFGDWEEIFRGIVVDGAIHFVDPNADLHQKRFYVAEPAAVAAEVE